jgi:hypothetical protein
MANSLGLPIESYGYAGTIAPNVPWADMQYTLGRMYFVTDDAAGRVTPSPTGTREVTIGVGRIGGWGVLDNITAPITVQLPSVTSGTKYFLIVARRTWGATQATSIAYIDAGTSATIPARNVSRGVLDDQPLALVPVTAGQTVPGAPIDLRLIGHSAGSFVAKSTLVLGIVTLLGIEVRIGTDTYRRVFNSAGSPTWEKDPGPLGSVPLSVLTQAGVGATEDGWTMGGLDNRAKIDGNVVHIDYEVRRTGARIIPDASTGNFLDTRIATLAPILRPSKGVWIPCLYMGGAATTALTSTMGMLYLAPSGVLTLAVGTGGVPLNTNPTANSYSIRATILHVKES